MVKEFDLYFGGGTGRKGRGVEDSIERMRWWPATVCSWSDHDGAHECPGLFPVRVARNHCVGDFDPHLTAFTDLDDIAGVRSNPSAVHERGDALNRDLVVVRNAHHGAVSFDVEIVEDCLRTVVTALELYLAVDVVIAAGGEVQMLTDLIESHSSVNKSVYWDPGIGLFVGHGENRTTPKLLVTLVILPCRREKKDDHFNATVSFFFKYTLS